MPTTFHFPCAYVKRVIDGDTFVVDIDLGMDLWKHEQHVRVFAYDAPELRTALGKQARDHARSLLSLPPVPFLPGLKVQLLSYEWDKYGRLLAAVSLPQGDLATLMINAGYVK